VRALRALLVILSLAGGVSAQVPGPQEDGSTLLPNGWSLRPAGRSVPLGQFPMSAALTPNGQFLVTLNAGLETSISVLETTGFQEVSRRRVPGAWLGITITADSQMVYISGGATGAIYEFSLSEEGALDLQRTFPIESAMEPETGEFVGDVKLAPNGRLIYATLPFRDQVIVVNPQSGWVIARYDMDRRPYRILFHPSGESFFVTSWADGTIDERRASNGVRITALRLGPQPMDMVWLPGAPEPDEGEEPPEWTSRIFVALANTNTVKVIGVTESGMWSIVDTVQIHTWPEEPLGMTPTSLALNEDGTQLYVVCADANAVAVVDVSGVRSRLVGFVPTGWYPTDVKAAGENVVVLNGKSDDARVIGAFDEAQLFQYTKTVIGNSPYNDNQLVVAPVPPGNPVPPGPDVPEDLASPIRHVLYIIKEDRSYDEVLGDMVAGTGAPGLVRFGPDATPNQHKLARDYVLFDNFYTNGAVDADGWQWSLGAIATPFVERLWRSTYSGRRETYDYEVGQPAAVPPAGYLWSNAVMAGLSVRNYGVQVENLDLPDDAGNQVRVSDRTLAQVTNLRYRGFDLDASDVERAREFIDDLERMEDEGTMPRLMLVRLGNDREPETVAENDYALGLIVEACSNSSFWEEMAIFVVEDDASGGRDHVHPQRAPAFIISPYTKRAGVDSTMYNTTSVLRTMELILGLRPMTHFDASAAPMWRAFALEPDTTPYEAEEPDSPVP